MATARLRSSRTRYMTTPARTSTGRSCGRRRRAAAGSAPAGTCRSRPSRPRRRRRTARAAPLQVGEQHVPRRGQLVGVGVPLSGLGRRAGALAGHVVAEGEPRAHRAAREDVELRRVSPDEDALVRRGELGDAGRDLVVARLAFVQRGGQRSARPSPARRRADAGRAHSATSGARRRPALAPEPEEAGRGQQAERRAGSDGSSGRRSARRARRATADVTSQSSAQHDRRRRRIRVDRRCAAPAAATRRARSPAAAITAAASPSA